MYTFRLLASPALPINTTLLFTFTDRYTVLFRVYTCIKTATTLLGLNVPFLILVVARNYFIHFYLSQHLVSTCCQQRYQWYQPTWCLPSDKNFTRDKLWIGTSSKSSGIHFLKYIEISSLQFSAQYCTIEVPKISLEVFNTLGGQHRNPNFFTHFNGPLSICIRKCSCTIFLVKVKHNKRKIDP